MQCNMHYNSSKEYQICFLEFIFVPDFTYGLYMYNLCLQMEDLPSAIKVFKIVHLQCVSVKKTVFAYKLPMRIARFLSKYSLGAMSMFYVEKISP